MQRFLVLAGFAISLSLSSLPAAQAQDLELNIGPDGPNLRMREDCNPRREDCRGRDRDRFHRRGGRECSPDRALEKAERMGLRRARIDRMGRRTIDVRGWRYGERVVVTFDRRGRRCRLLD